MPNVGKPSGGCVACRRRRVKCDEQKPECHRCVRLGEACPGYDRGLRIKFTDPSKRQKRSHLAKIVIPVSAQKKSEKSEVGEITQLRSSALRSASLHQQPSSKDQDQVLKDSEQIDRIEISAGLADDLESRSLNLFIASFVSTADQKYDHPLFLDFLPEMFMISTTASCFRKAVAAVARLNFINTYNAAALSTWATSSYADALAATNLSLSRSTTAYADETLASVWLLSFYEVLLSDTERHNQPKPTPWRNHINGTLTLLLKRGTKQLATRSGRQLFILVHTTIMIMTMMAGEKPPEVLCKLVSDYLKTSPGVKNGEFLVARYLQQVGGWRATLLKQSDVMHDSVELANIAPDLHCMLRQAMINRENSVFEVWAHSMPEWRPRQTEQAIRAAAGEPRFFMYSFTSIFVASNWATYWTARLLLMQSLLNSQMHSTGTEQFDGLMSQLHAAANNIIGSVGFAFNDTDLEGKPSERTLKVYSVYFGSSIGAVHLFWPLGAVLASPYTDSEQKILGRNALRSVGLRFRVAQALNYV